MAKPDYSALIQAALDAGKVSVTRVAEGDRTIDEQTFRRNRGDRLAAALRSEDSLINERHVVVDHRGVEHVRNGLGEWLS